MRLQDSAIPPQHGPSTRRDDKLQGDWRRHVSCNLVSSDLVKKKAAKKAVESAVVKGKKSIGMPSPKTRGTLKPAAPSLVITNPSMNQWTMVTFHNGNPSRVSKD
ncbi:hypothetical protein AMTR_s00072p00121340 [Amborella trichopoda]|uniref:Uncharacterized protein n=1 Tax=Amborella trichopoda TaxID=13333 RepID=W1NUU1_AMBTC|nr:hypothetical protein AMTR_s00072p00121340 [Amborella trichopoda]